MKKKYEILYDQFIEIEGDIRVYPVRALKDFLDVKKGDLGGYIENESNLSHNGNCWVRHQAIVYNKSYVFGDAQVCGRSRIFDHAQISGKAIIMGDSCVYGYTRISGEAEISGSCNINKNPHISLDAVIKDDTDYIVMHGFGERQITFFATENGVGVGESNNHQTAQEFLSSIKNKYGVNSREFKEYDLLLQAIIYKLNSKKRYRTRIFNL